MRTGLLTLCLCGCNETWFQRSDPIEDEGDSGSALETGDVADSGRGTLAPEPPVAVINVAGSSFLPGDIVYLDGDSSSDPNGDTLSFRWSLVRWPAGATPVLEFPTTSRTELYVETHGEYDVQLIVSDGTLKDQTEATIRVARDTAQP